MIKDYRISNIYYMLAYAFQDYHFLKNNNQKVETENFENIYDLFSFILTLSTKTLIKKGLYRSYEVREDELNQIKGKVNLSESFKKNKFAIKKVICEYDDFSSNNYLNKIIKTTMYYLIKSQKTKDEYKKLLKKNYLLFQDIELLECRKIEWIKIKYNRHNIHYKYIINVCYLILNSLIINQNNGKIEFLNFIDIKHLEQLFEKFVRNYYAYHYPILNPRIVKMKWKIDEGYMIDFIPIMKTDITLTYDNSMLIIDTKFHKYILLTQNFDNDLIRKIDRNDWNQINVYVANAAYKNNLNVSGMLLYAKTDEEILPDISTSVMGNKIYVKTLDMRQKFDEIAQQLNQIANNFIERKI